MLNENVTRASCSNTGHGAKPTITNDLGRDVFAYCDAFPAIKSAIARIRKEQNRVELKRTRSKNLVSRLLSKRVNPLKAELRDVSSNCVSLQRRLSTATSIKCVNVQCSSIGHLLLSLRFTSLYYLSTLFMRYHA